MTVIMANCVGPAEGFVGAGQSGIWSPHGELICSVDSSRDAFLVYDFGSGEHEIVGLADPVTVAERFPDGQVATVSSGTVTNGHRYN
jgi:predicted amidohydrolase